jgi:hypothetical protein
MFGIKQNANQENNKIPFFIDQNVEIKLEEFINRNFTKQNSLKTFHSSVYIENEKLLLVLFQNGDTKECSLLTYHPDNSKDIKLLPLTLKLNNKVIRPDFTEIHLHPNQKEICLFGKEALAFLKVENLNSNEKTLTIDITHVSQGLNYTKLKFSNYDNFFGVLLANNTFRYYNIECPIAEHVIELDELKCVDFEFGPVLDSGWLNFSIFFLDLSGAILYSCPVFPSKFSLPENYIANMKNIIRVKKDCEKYTDIKEAYEIQNTIIGIIEQGRLGESNNYIRRKALHNDQHVIEKLSVIDKRHDINKLTPVGEENKYASLYVLKIFPLVIVRVNTKGIIEVLFSNSFINPTNTVNRTSKIDLYIIDSVYLKTDISSNPIPKLFDVYGETKLLFNTGCDIVEIDLGFITEISKLYKSYHGQDLKVNTRSKVSKIKSMENSAAIKYYFAINKIESNLILMHVFNGKVKVKIILCTEDIPPKTSLVEEIRNEVIYKSGVNFKEIENLTKR